MDWWLELATNLACPGCHPVHLRSSARGASPHVSRLQTRALQVELYWECLKQAAPAELRGDYPAGGEWFGSRGLLHAEVASAASISAALALMLGMVCACRVIGWHVVARSAVLVISVSTGVLGAALLGAGAAMAASAARSNRPPWQRQ